MKNHIVIISIVTILIIFLTGQIEYKLPEYEGSDLNKYIAMAESSPELNLNVIRPFVYRILAPWIVGIMPFSIPVNFFLLNFISLFSLSFVFYFFLLEFQLSPNVALTLTIAFQMNKYFFQFLSWNYFQLADTMALLILFSTFILIKRESWFPLVLLMPISILVKEYTLIIIPTGLFYFVFYMHNKKTFFYFSLISFVTIAVYIFIRTMIDTNEGVDLLTQYTTKEFYYSRKMLFLKKYIAAFTPFGLLPILFYKELVLFFKKYTFLLVYTITVIVISYFGEAERMMAPLAPIYFLFIGNLIEEKLKIDKKAFFDNRVLIPIIAISFFTSFYHLWGVFQLPNKYWSMVNTIIFTIIIGFIFYNERVKISSVNQNLNNSI